MKALGRMDFTKYALSTIIYLMQSSENGQVKNPVSLSKNIFSASNFFMHIFNISVTYMQSVEKIQQRPLRGDDFTKYALSTIVYQVQSSKKWLS